MEEAVRYRQVCGTSHCTLQLWSLQLHRLSRWVIGFTVLVLQLTLLSQDDAWTKPSILYTTSASLLLALIPYTFFIGEPVNRQLEAKVESLALSASEDGIPKDETTHALVDKWATINLGKAVLAGVSALVATWAAVDRAEVVPATFSFSTGANRF